MMVETEQTKKANIRLSYEISRLRKHCKSKGIKYSEIQRKTGLGNVSRMMTNKSPNPNFITFLLIAEAIGFEIKIELRNNL